MRFFVVSVLWQFADTCSHVLTLYHRRLDTRQVPQSFHTQVPTRRFHDTKPTIDATNHDGILCDPFPMPQTTSTTTAMQLLLQLLMLLSVQLTITADATATTGATADADTKPTIDATNHDGTLCGPFPMPQTTSTTTAMQQPVPYAYSYSYSYPCTYTAAPATTPIRRLLRMLALLSP
jgi:hypothetical protein